MSPSSASPVTDSLLRVSDLGVSYPTPDGPVTLVQGVSFELTPGSALGLVGESGSGKTMTLRALVGLLPPHMSISGSVRLDGAELVGMSERQFAQIRGRRIAMVPQDPMASLNPIRRIGSQLAEGCRLQLGIGRTEARARVLDYLDRVGLPDAERVVHRFPHQLSGGMRQRVMIAMALLSDPQIILCDEPTTALDVTIQAQILRLLRRICEDVGAALIFVSHDLAVIRQVCRDVSVMYAGRVAETGPVADVFADPRHGYTASLLRSLPDMDHPEKPNAIPGEPPDPRRPPTGCRFHPRCPYAVAACTDLPHELIEILPLRRSACIHGATGLPAPVSLSTADVLALVDAEEADLEAIEASGLGPAGPGSVPDDTDESDPGDPADQTDSADARVTG